MSLMENLRELRDRDGVTCLMTTHLMADADACDEVGILDEGRLVALDTPGNLKARVGGDVLTVRGTEPARLAERVRTRFGGAVDVFDGGVRIARARGHEFVPELIESFPGEIESVTIGKPTLEDVFVRLTGHGLHHE